jgi:protein TonB
VPTAGPGTNPGAGEGERGTGLGHGPGHHAGFGPGSGGNLTPPELIRQLRPNYTSAALQARLRGIVVMDVVVQADGSVGDVKIVRSLDPIYGLDQEAIKAVRQWRFRPGSRAGKPVPMLVTVEMVFELR